MPPAAAKAEAAGGRDRGDREAGGSKPGSAERSSRGGGARDPSHEAALALTMASTGAHTGPAAGRGSLAALGPASPPASPSGPAPQMQQVAAMLQGQLRMLQTQQSALLRQYEQQLRTVVPGPPPSAYSLFQLDMFRVYQEEGFDIDPTELQPIISNAWHQLTAEERAGYDARAQQELSGWTASAQLYAVLYAEYEMLSSHLGSASDLSMVPKAVQPMLPAARQTAKAGGSLPGAIGASGGSGGGAPPGGGRGSGSGRGAGAGGRGGGRGVKRSGMDALAGATALLGMGGGGYRGGGDDDDDDEDYEAEAGTASKRARRAISPAVVTLPPTARPPPRNTRLPAERLPTGVTDLPQQFNVSCNDVMGTFIMDGIKVVCHCKDCADTPRSQREFHPTHWEQHCGAGTAKKWKASIKIEPGGAPEVPLGANPMQIGKWFDMLGVEFRPAKTTGGPPVLEFTGATIRRLEATEVGPMVAAPPAAASPVLHAPTPPPPMQPSSLAPPRPAQSRQPTAPHRGSAPPAGPAGVGASGAATGASKPPRPVSDGDGVFLGVGDGEYCPAPTSGPPPDTIGPGSGGSRRDGSGSGLGSGRGNLDGDGDSSSRGSASDTLAPNTTA
ncbi:hypothetical protein HYH03_008288 [Edaphochlamys debaryana]|uniref:HMG box domain-containing protein n=1 Tax=Edaphochlamys debaryana TaxID=47281 RepID=A0A835Y075_9CHLO|nr:hypothetical protein HYH03_008288 [Edaphochlamys debaryana]|eukprot:KAG2493471.1 hypothetical protein HYH03_008288 [Edaphochlamys debaryana]